MSFEQLTMMFNDDEWTENTIISETPIIDNEFLLQDRVQKIQQIIKKYGEENFYIAFSGGKDSTVLSWLIDYALPDNNIPRVYIDTGIDLTMIRQFVLDKQKQDNRVKIVKPSLPIKETLEKYGYPFKSKKHAKNVDIFRRLGCTKTIRVYLGLDSTSNKSEPENERFQCPQILRYQFKEEHNLNISDKCCIYLKEKPLSLWARENNKKYYISGIMVDEGGRRRTAKCLAFRNKKFVAFQPLVPITKEWEKWLIEKYDIKICDIYKSPYNFKRTGCKGCPFAINLQQELDVLEQYFPNERKQCEYIWKPVYQEYRRLNYRLKPINDGQIEGQMTFDDYK